LSGGLRRRVELAKGLLHQPGLLLLDEPSTGLDPGARRDFWDYLNLLRGNDGVTVLLTTHLLEEADRCDRLAILHRGELVASGSPDSLKKDVGAEVILMEVRGRSFCLGWESALRAPSGTRIHPPTGGGVSG